MPRSTPATAAGRCCHSTATMLSDWSISPVRSGLELEAIASAVVGGVSLFGGMGTVLGMVLGTIALASIEVGLVAAGAPSFWYTAFVGCVIIVIVVINTQLDQLIFTRRS